ncbi:hypothetical protein HDU97_004358 [Phlyctochytrium planicorne]|nr:hypothetical protein HDU97_004358 [Phlyctochytrium planicorne]
MKDAKRILELERIGFEKRLERMQEKYNNASDAAFRDRAELRKLRRDMLEKDWVQRFSLNVAMARVCAFERKQDPELAEGKNEGFWSKEKVGVLGRELVQRERNVRFALEIALRRVERLEREVRIRRVATVISEEVGRSQPLSLDVGQDALRFLFQAMALALSSSIHVDFNKFVSTEGFCAIRSFLSRKNVEIRMRAVTWISRDDRLITESVNVGASKTSRFIVELSWADLMLASRVWRWMDLVHIVVPSIGPLGFRLTPVNRISDILSLIADVEPVVVSGSLGRIRRDSCSACADETRDSAVALDQDCDAVVLVKPVVRGGESGHGDGFDAGWTEICLKH